MQEIMPASKEQNWSSEQTSLTETA